MLFVLPPGQEVEGLPLRSASLFMADTVTANAS